MVSVSLSFSVTLHLLIGIDNLLTILEYAIYLLLTLNLLIRVSGDSSVVCMTVLDPSMQRKRNNKNP